MEHLSLEEETRIKDIRNIFTLNNELNYTAFKYTRNSFRIKKETKAIEIEYLEILRIFLSMKKNKIIIKKVRVSNFWTNRYIEYEGNSDRNKTLSVEEHLDKTKQHLKDIINYQKKHDTWKIKLTNNFISSIDNDEDHAMHSKSDNIQIMIKDEADGIIKELFDSLKKDTKIIWNR